MEVEGEISLPLEHPESNRTIGDDLPPEFYRFLFSSLVDPKSLIFSTSARTGSALVGAVQAGNFYGGIHLAENPLEHLGACWWNIMDVLQTSNIKVC